MITNNTQREVDDTDAERNTNRDVNDTEAGSNTDTYVNIMMLKEK